MAEQLTDCVYVLPGGTNIGVVIADDGRALLIDTGLNDTQARKALRFVREELDTDVRAIVNTHGHADHFGGNAWLVKRTNAEVYASDLEETTLRHPLMQSIMLYGGADPVDALRTSFLVANPSPVTGVVQSGINTIAGITFEAVALGGHSINQLGYLIDGIFFCADVVFPADILEKYPIPYLHGLTEHIASLAVAESISCDRVVPGHGPILDNIADLVVKNRQAIDVVITTLLEVIDRPMLADEICRAVFTRMNLQLADPQAYYLLRPTISAYLAHLDRIGEIRLEMRDASVVWVPKG